MTPIDRNRLWTALILVGAAIVLFLVGRDMEQPLPKAPEIAGDPSAQIDFKPLVARFSTSELARIHAPAGKQSPFHTAHFDPPPPKPKPTPPPAPATRKVSLLFQGFFETPAGERTAYILVDDKMLIARKGTEVAGGYAVAEIERERLTLRKESEEAVLLFRTKAELEVPR